MTRRNSMLAVVFACVALTQVAVAGGLTESSDESGWGHPAAGDR